MTVNVANASNTNTLYYLRDRMNELAAAMSTKAITVNSNAATGNAVVNGVFVANTIVVNSGLRGGTETVANVLNVTSNVSINSASQLSISSGFVATSTSLKISGTGNLTINASMISVNSVPIMPEFCNTQISGNTTQIFDFWPLTSYRSGEYQISIKDNEANNYQISKVLVIHDDGISPLSTDYGVLYSNTQLAQFSANANSTHVRMLITGLQPNASTNLQIKAIRQLVTV